MQLHPIKLVTIIAPKKLKEDILALLKSAGISGYTYYYVYGGGEPQLKGEESEETENIKFRILVSNLLAVTLMKCVSEMYFGKEKVIIFGHDTDVIRHGKFDRVEYEN